MKHIELLEKAVKIQRRLNGFGLEVYVNVWSDNFFKGYLSLKNKQGKSYWIERDDKIDTIIKEARELLKPTYIKLKGICIDSIDSTVYIKQDETYSPLELLGITKEGVMLSDGFTHSFDAVYAIE